MECVNDKPSKKLIRSKSGLRIVVTDDYYKSPFVIGEPLWTPDKEVSNCKKCFIKFGFTTRKHHCRRCGQIYCSACCDEKLELLRMCFVDPVRVCSDCAPVTVQENKFFECHLKILTGGASFIYNRPDGNKRSLDDHNDDVIILCKLSQDHRYIFFDIVTGGNNIDSEKEVLSQLKQPLQLCQIKYLRVFNNFPTTGVSSMELEYVTSAGASNDFPDDNDAVDILRLSIPAAVSSDAHQNNTYKQSAAWILAMQQALKMLYENQHGPHDDANSAS